MKSMTEGNPVKLILQFALPLLLGNLLQQTYNMIDAAIVGRVLGADALAGVGASSSVQFLVLGFCMGICAGFSVPVAKYFGAQDQNSLRRTIAHAYLLTGFFAFVMTLATTLLCTDILHIMKTPGKIFEDAYVYLFIIFLGIPFSLLYNLLAGILRAVGDSKTPFMFLVISTVSNIVLDLFFIVVIRMGCAGAALATVLAQAMSGILCFFYIQKKYPLLRMTRADWRFQKRAFAELLYMGIPMGLQYSITAIGSMVMQSANNGLGSDYVSGFTVGSKLKQFAMCPFDALATGVSVFASQNMGSRNAKRIRQGILSGLFIGVGYGVISGLVLILFGRTLSLLFVEAKFTDVLDASAQYVRCLGMFYWILGILNICRMSIQGLGYSGVAVFSGAIEMLARILVSRIFVPIYGFLAICYTDQSAWITATIYCVIVCSWCVRRVSKRFAAEPTERATGSHC